MKYDLTLDRPRRPSIAPSPALEHILHPTDLAAESANAFAHALRLAIAARAGLSLVHVANGGQAGAEWERFPKVRALLERWDLLPSGAPETVVADLFGVHVRKTDLDHPDPALGLANYAGLNACDLIVLGTHAREGVARWAFGSVAGEVARKARKAALFVPDGGHGFVSRETGNVWLRNVLVPVDESPDPTAAIALAVELARTLGAEDAVFHLLHVGAEPLWVEMPEGVAATRETASGPVAVAIHAAAQRCDADLIVMATEGRHGFLDALRGSVSEQVIRQTGRPVLAVPA